MEHIVDTVLYFEGDKMLPYRRAVREAVPAAEGLPQFLWPGFEMCIRDRYEGGT